MPNIKKFVVKFLESEDLTDEQINITRFAYESNADEYVLNYERRVGALDEARIFTLDPFLKLLSEKKMTSKVLFAGCGSGRDLQEAVEQGFTCVGIDISVSMLNIGKILSVKAPLLNMDIERMEFPVKSFSGIFCDTAITHIKRKGIKKVLSDFYNLLEDSGVLFVSFRKGSGKLYMTNDRVGKRYYTTMLTKRARALLHTTGFKVVSISTHKIGLRPAYYNLLAIKK